MRKRFSIRLLLVCAATFHIPNASASREVEAAFERSCARISTGTRRAASRDGGVGTAHGKPQPNGRKRLGSQYRGAPSGIDGGLQLRDNTRAEVVDMCVPLHAGPCKSRLKPAPSVGRCGGRGSPGTGRDRRSGSRWSARCLGRGRSVR